MPSKRKITPATTTTTITTTNNNSNNTNTTNTTSTADDADTTIAPGADDSPAPSSAAPAKRQRVSRACDQCRAAREKCDGIQPLCFPCVSQNRPCTYAANPKKRGVQTGYIKTLEVALAWLFEKVPGCEEALENLLLHEGGQGQNLLVGKDSDRANRLHKRWRKSKVHREIDRILSGGDATQSRAEKSSPSEDEESDTGLSDKTMRTLQSSTSTTHGKSISQSANGRSSGRGAGDGSHPAAFDNTAPNKNSNNNKKLKLPSNHWDLVDIYFSYTHCWYPILEKQDLLKTVYHYPEAGLDIQQLGPHPAAHAELWAAMALAAYQDAASTTPNAAATETQTPSLCPDEIYSIARRLVPLEDGDFEIQHARALLLLALINVGKGKKTSAWILVGLAHRIALDVSELYNNDERSSRSATAVLMGCYILDTLVSVHRRGMPSLETAGIIEGMSIPEDNLDEWQPWAPCRGFGTLSRLSSRSPAYSLTTFNQVYDVFKFMRKRTLQRQNGLLPTEHPAEAMMLLHQTIKPGLPFANFIVARDSSSVTIPSAYVLRILYLWVGAILDSTDESPCILILESVDQYLAQFGACGAPPFFSSCLAMMRQHRSFNDLHPQSKDRWQAVQNTLTSTWTPPSKAINSSPETVRPASAISKATGVSSSDTPAPSTSTHTAASLTTTTPSDIFPAPNAVHTPTLLPNQYPPPQQANGPFLMNPFSPSKQSQSHPPQSLSTTAAAGGSSSSSNVVSMNMFDHPNMIHGLAGPPGLGGRPPPPPGMGHHRESFGAASLDYDAMLDDLSSMDYIDRVDADPQFMANLGFAPGCDISEILSREFGAI